jgi:hypothetical protein
LRSASATIADQAANEADRNTCDSNGGSGQ